MAELEQQQKYEDEREVDIVSITDTKTGEEGLLKRSRSPPTPIMEPESVSDDEAGEEDEGEGEPEQKTLKKEEKEPVCVQCLQPIKEGTLHIPRLQELIDLEAEPNKELVDCKYPETVLFKGQEIKLKK